VGRRDWLTGWSPRSSRLLCEIETADARAALVDTNGDGRELWFGLDVRGPSGEWTVALDWDDVGGHQPVGRVDDLDVVFGWGTGQPRQRRVIQYDGVALPVSTNRNGWWLLLASAPAGRIDTDTH
jgi:hypothetical protein